MSEEIINVPAPLGRAKALSVFLVFGGGADLLFYLCFNVCNSKCSVSCMVWYPLPVDLWLGGGCGCGGGSNTSTASLVPAGHRYRGEYHLGQGKSVDTRHGNTYMYIS